MATVRRSLLSTLAAVALGIALVPMPVSPAQASADQLTCGGIDDSTYSPPLTNVEQSTTISIHTSFAPCVSLTQPHIVSGLRTITLTRQTSCASLLHSNPVTMTISWSDGQSSTLTGQSESQLANGVLVTTVIGSVSGGAFAAATFVYQISALASSVNLCLLGLGTVAELTGPIELVIAGL